SNSILLASDFALKRVIATHFDTANYDPATLASAALSYQRRIDAQLLWITDENGVLLVHSPGPSHMRQSLAAFSPLKEALETEEASTTIAEVDGVLFQLFASSWPAEVRGRFIPAGPARAALLGPKMLRDTTLVSQAGERFLSLVFP